MNKYKSYFCRSAFKSIRSAMKPVPDLVFFPQTMEALLPVVESVLPLILAWIKFSKLSSNDAFPSGEESSFLRV